MRPPILVGIVLAAVIAGAWVLAPGLRDPARKKAEQAEEQAALAERQLARYNLGLTLLAARIDPAGLEAGDLEGVAAKVGDELKEISSKYAALAREAQRRAEQLGLPAPTLVRLTPDASGLQSAVREFRKQVEQNEALLRTALANGQAAVGLGPNVLGVPQALGLAEYVRAAGLLVAAQELRIQQADAQARLLEVGSRWKLARGQLDHYRGLDLDPILALLRADHAELRQLHQQASADLATLSAQAEQCSQRLTEVQQALQEAQAQLLALETGGFRAGDDDGAEGFNAYRRRYEALLQEVRGLQQQEQELRWGVRQGAELVGEDLLTAEIRGGQPVIGLEQLQRRLAVARERVRRLERADLSLEEQIKYVTEAGQRARQNVEYYQRRAGELEAEQKEIVQRIQALASEAFNKEAEALTAAEAAVRAFAQAQRAEQAWMQAARDLQRQRDPNRRNPRLTRLTRDPYLEEVGRSGEAAARVLAGRIHAQRVESSRRLIGDMRLFSELNPDFVFDPSPFRAHLQTACDAGRTTLEAARDLYAAVAEKLGNQPTVWVPLAAQATVHHLLARVDWTQAEPHRAKAAELIQEVAKKCERFPYARTFVLLADRLRPGPAPAQRPGEEEEAGFFRDEQ